MSKQASTSTVRVAKPVTFNAPREGSICAMAWDIFGQSPTTSAMLPGIAERTGFNLTNLRIELSRFNRYMRAHSAQ